MINHKQNKRIGIASGGNWIVDRVKIIDSLPRRGMLANICSEQLSTGGAPANVLADLARLGAEFPLTGIGVIGDDTDGLLILDTFRALGVDMSGITIIKNVQTSYTDVMTEIDSGDRSFFHNRGANALFTPEHVDIDSLSCRIFHLGYLLLLDKLDQADDEYGTVAARFLCALHDHGITTSMDLVSEDSDRYKSIVPPALEYVDYLILNEIETARIVGREIRTKEGNMDRTSLLEAVEELYTLGNMKLVAVHMPEGVFMRDSDGNCYSHGSLKLPEGFIKGSVGAGDAFCAGMLYGLHEGWSYDKSAHLGISCATASLSCSGATDGLKPLQEVIEIGDKYPERKAPVEI